MDSTRTDLPTVRVAALSARVPMWGLADFYDAAYTRIRKTAERAGWALVGPAVGWYHAAPGDTADLTVGYVVDDVEVGTVAEGVEVLDLPGGDALVATFTGAYDRLGDAWARLGDDLAARGLDGRGDFWEEYVTEPSPGGDPEQNVTRLVLPLRADP